MDSQEIGYCLDDTTKDDIIGDFTERNKQWMKVKDGSSTVNCSLSTVVVSCIDSRLPVEKIFQAKPGELLVLKNAGNIITQDIVRSVLVAVYELKTKYVIILGHTECGMAILDNTEKMTHLKEKMGDKTLGEIQKLANEDPLKWFGFFNQGKWVENAENQSQILKNFLEELMPEEYRPVVITALYDIVSGEVKFLE
jgi:carbonic anhydrase